MKDHTGMQRQYIHMSEAWYADSALRLGDMVDEVSFGLYAPADGGTTGEMTVRWIEIGQPSGRPAPKLGVFCDGWNALATFGDVIARLAEVDDQDISPAEFCAILTECGFIDNTPRVSPYAPKPKRVRRAPA